MPLKEDDAFLKIPFIVNNKILFFLVFSVVLVSRLPFLDAGYGNDPDGWRIAAAARYIAQTGEYKASRYLGYPVVELTCSLVWKHGAWAMNLLSALASAVAAGILALIAKFYGCKDSILLAMAFASTPAVFIGSTIAMDYMWAMMFLVAGWYAGLINKPAAAGCLLGLAAGCRITTIAMVIPLSILFYEKNDLKQSYLRITKFWLAAGIIIFAVFVPVFLTYGLQTFSGFSQGSFPPVTIIAKIATLDVWGAVGLVALLVILILMLKWRKKIFDPSIPKTLAYKHILLWIAVLVLYSIEFVLHPMEGAYLIPAIPFFLLISARYIPRMQWIIVCVIMILSPFFISIDSADRYWSPEPSKASFIIHPLGRSIAVDFLHGPIWKDYSKRIQRINFIQDVIAAGDTLSKPSVVAAGAWLPYIVQATPGAQPESFYPDYTLCRGHVRYIGLMNQELLSRYQQQKLKLYYLPTVDDYNWNVFSIDLKKEGALEFVPAHRIASGKVINL